MGLQRQDIVVVASVQVRVTTLQDLRWAMPGDPLQGRFLGAHLPGEEDPGAGPIEMAKTQLSGKIFLEERIQICCSTFYSQDLKSKYMLIILQDKLVKLQLINLKYKYNLAHSQTLKVVL